MKTKSLVLLAALISICSGMLGGFASYELFKNTGFGVIRASGIEIIDADGKVRSRLEDGHLRFLSSKGGDLLVLGTQEVRGERFPELVMNNSSGRNAVEIWTDSLPDGNGVIAFDGDHGAELLLGQFLIPDEYVGPKSGEFIEWGLAVKTAYNHSTGIGIVESPDGKSPYFLSPVSGHQPEPVTAHSSVAK
jgi:hypothetical protein